MTTQAIVGGAVFNLVTIPQSIKTSRKASFVGHEVVDAPIIYEGTGEGEGRFTIEGVIYPMALGTTGTLTLLEVIRSARVPVPFILGNGMPKGWVIIDQIERGDETLDDGGTGRKIQFSLQMLWAGRPSGLSLARQIIGLF